MSPRPLAAALAGAVASGAPARAQHGCSFEAGVLEHADLAKLAAPIASPGTSWAALAPVVGPVSQFAREHIASKLPPWLVELASELAGAGHIPADACPELTYMRYPGRTGHVSPHRDRRGYIGMILIISLEGTAEFAIHGSRNDADVLASWVARPGDVAVMTGAPWREGQQLDSRPFHSVHARGRDRTSVTIRFTIAARHR